MKILALEFSSVVRSVAIVAGPKMGYAAERGGRELKPFALIDAALAEAAIRREDIDCIAVGLGPGSYAGIRIAIAIAQGWQIARGARLLGISSADAAAAQAGKSGTADLFVGLDGQRDDLFVARYDASVPGRPKAAEPFRILAGPQRTALERSGKLFRMDWAAEPAPPAGIGSPPDARMIATLAAERTDFIAAQALEPIYLRRAEFVKAPLPKFPAS